MAAAQIPEPVMQHIEEWVEQWGEETLGEEWLEQYAVYLDNPININDTTSEALLGLSLLSDFQHRSLLAYIRQQGALLSYGELSLINGFDSLTLAVLRPIVKVAPSQSHTRLSLQEMLTHGSSHVVVGSHGTVEQARGYREGQYEGNNYRLYARYLFKYKEHLQLQLSADKDPGEAFFSGSCPQGFDFYGGHLLLNNLGRLQRAVVGQYHLQFGQGLTLWSGFAPYASGGANMVRYSQGIRPSSAFLEYGYLQGAATTISVAPHCHLTAFYSVVDRDATPSKNDTLAMQSISQSGYHRTASEIAKRNLLTEHLYGAHAEYLCTSLRLGATLYHTQLSKPLLPMESRYNYYAFRGDALTVGGVDFSWRLHHWLLFGEASYSFSYDMAALFGVQCYINSQHQLSLSCRHYGKNFQNLHAAAMGQSSRPQGEQGVMIAYQANLPHAMQLRLNSDIYRFSSLQYGIYAPSVGFVQRVSLSVPINRKCSLYFRYRYKERPRNNSDQIYYLDLTALQQFHLDFAYSPIRSLLLTSRAGYCKYVVEQNSPQQGLLFCQDIAYTPATVPFTLTARIVFFNVDDYNARLYLAESDFLYDSGTPSYTDQGLRSYIIARYQVSHNLTIGAKYSITNYFNKSVIGSSYEQIESSHRQQWKVQLRWSIPHSKSAVPKSQ